MRTSVVLVGGSDVEVRFKPRLHVVGIPGLILRGSRTRCKGAAALLL